MAKEESDIPVLASQLAAQNMLIQILMGQITLSTPDHGRVFARHWCRAPGRSSRTRT